jgi:hypothetical protein
MKISVITPYFNRPEMLARFIRENIEKHHYLTNVEWIITTTKKHADEIKTDAKVCVIEDDKVSLGRMRNIAVEQAAGEYVLKQDIDCQFDMLPELLKEKTYQEPIMNIGVRYTDKVEQAYGNEYLIRRDIWLKAGGEPEWDGYGWEDYGLMAKIIGRTGIDYSKIMSVDTCTDFFRDNVARVLNRQHRYWMFHHKHNYDGAFTSKMHENKQKFFDLYQDIWK